MCSFTPIHDMHVANLARIPEELAGAERAKAEDDVLELMRFRVGERNEWSCDISTQHPQLLTFIGVDPVLTGDELEAEVERRHATGAKGIKLHPPVQRVNLDDERWFPALAAAERLGWVVLTHMGPFGDSSGDYATVERATRLAERFPELPIILAHGGGPDRPATLAALAQFPNLLVDTVSLIDGPRINELSDEQLAAELRELGTDRIVFGSDYCFIDPRRGLERLRRLPLTAEESRPILHDTAARLLGLD
jgi:predicted TIM-barrel fold metal-dependent hydrolase